LKKIEVQGAHESLFIVIEPGAIAASLFLMLQYRSKFKLQPRLSYLLLDSLLLPSTLMWGY